jgi:hypothetical protein
MWLYNRVLGASVASRHLNDAPVAIMQTYGKTGLDEVGGIQYSYGSLEEVDNELISVRKARYR